MVSPIVAAIASFFIPGLGQYLGGQGAKKAIIFFAIAVVVNGILAAIGLSFVYIVYAIFAAYDAYTNIE